MSKPHWKRALACVITGAIPLHAMAVVTLADQPVLSTTNVPGNLALALSVEYPTAESTAHIDDYDVAKTFLGYFDPDKCYTYVADTSAYTTVGGVAIDATKGDNSYFNPTSKATSHACSGTWSGNFLNWATMSTIDPFRWAMTGGNRVVDEVGNTILQKSYHYGSSAWKARTLTSAQAGGATDWGSGKTLTMGVGAQGFTMTVTNGSTTKRYTVRVKVCVSSVGLESNCVAYGSNYKPEGLIQKYSNEIRFSAFGYLNDDNVYRDGAVLRARQKFVGPTQPQPGQPSIANTLAEWSSTDGRYVRNPDSADATATTGLTGTSSSNQITIADSGVVNYLNKFGQIYPGKYKSIDPVNELYYAALRYYRNLDNVSTWSWLKGSATSTDGAPTAATNTTALLNTFVSNQKKWLDGFPVITNWTSADPIQYSCQRNFILGIGDVNTHRDRNVPGDDRSQSSSALEEPPIPAFGNDATFFTAYKSATWVRGMQGITSNAAANTGSTNSPDYMAGLAYQANVLDIRPDDATKPQTTGKQTVQTYWVDVMENAAYKQNNKFYMAAKYGGMKVPSNYKESSYSATTPIPEAWWYTNGETVGTSTSNSQKRPDNYFTGGRPDTLVSGLTRAFESIVGDIKSYTTTFSLASKQVVGDSVASYAAQYDSSDWSGEVTGSSITISSSGDPVVSPTATWTTRKVFENQLGSSGWNNARFIATTTTSTNGTSSGIPFRYASLSDEQKTLLNTSYVSGDDASNYVNFLRGDYTNEGNGYRVRSTTMSTGIVRSRLGDIVNSKITAVGAPLARYADIFNPGYSAFKTTYKARPTTLYVGANDGMLHAFKGGLDTGAGQELFAYIPSTLFYKSLSADSDGLLARLGNPTYVHRNYVDATALNFDIDFARAGGATQADATISDWRTVLIGGLGKGGRSYYALDVTDPSLMTTEAAVAGKVLWEFPARNKLPTASGGTCTTNCINMGYSFGDPVVVKTAKYGWVVVFSSGYNNADGIGHIFIVNPTNGALLQDITTGTTAVTGMARPAAYVLDYMDFVSDAIYVGDLEGRVWRFPLNKVDAGGNYLAPTIIAKFTSPTTSSATLGAAQPITTQPLIEIDPWTRNRFVMIGTGRLLDGSDISDPQAQSFYAIIDGYSDQFAAKASDGEDWPALRTDFAVVTSTDGTSPAKANMAGKAGWVIDLGVTSNVGWRVIGTTTAYNGIVGFSSVLPAGDACNPSGRSNVYAVNFANGASVLKNSTNDIVSYLAQDSLIIDMSFFNVNGKVQSWIGDSKGNQQKLTGAFTTQRTRSLNWRELSTVR
ncbi:pilus assembly protein [Diaphorobacter sp. HDW4A]|uniref:pilus assembly protein n=1 Tax=Diaphorobacter sp. HDW4A TaxID=2714924 RepID=UPI001408C10F|nr:PilC/PilY family type IV pilus protein [Diaphorobacter sp. HDW4A]QIL78596.1 pilus assembly protein [Diaphorobacter sp. HDW4A]